MKKILLILLIIIPLFIYSQDLKIKTIKIDNKEVKVIEDESGNIFLMKKLYKNKDNKCFLFLGKIYKEHKNNTIFIYKNKLYYFIIKKNKYLKIKKIKI